MFMMDVHVFEVYKSGWRQKWGLDMTNNQIGTINYEYDPATGRLTRTYTAYTDTRYTYDALGRLSTVSSYKLAGQDFTNDPQVTTYTYTADGTLASVTLPNGVETDYGYDALNRLVRETIEKVVSGVATLMQTYAYTLQTDGSRTSSLEVTYGDAGTVSSADEIDWTYDALDRLTKEIRSSVDPSTVNDATPAITGTEYSDAYTLDLVGNRLRKVHTDSDSTRDETITSTYNARDELTQDASTLNGTTTYTYDANGSTISEQNPTTGQNVVYHYDVRNRMDSADTNGDGTPDVYYVYDDSGNRVAEITPGGDTYYVQDDYNPTGYSQVLEEVPGQGVAPSKAYVIGNDIIAQATSSAVDYLLKDGHGNTRILLSAAIQILQRYTFDAFGNAYGFDAAAALTRQLLADGRYDPQTGLEYQRARYRQDGRFLSADTYMGNSVDPVSLHKYLYADANPINGYDPSGHFELMEQLVNVGIQNVLMGMLGNIVKPAVNFLAQALLPADLVNFVKNHLPTALEVGGNLTGQLPGKLGLFNGNMGVQFVLGRDQGSLAGAVLVAGGIGLGGTVSQISDNFESEKVPTVAGYIGGYWNLHSTTQLSGKARFNISISYNSLPNDLKWVVEKDVQMEAAQVLLNAVQQTGSELPGWSEARQLYSKLNDLYGLSIDFSFGYPITSQPIGIAIDYTPQATYASRRSSSIGAGTMVQFYPDSPVNFG